MNGNVDTIRSKRFRLVATPVLMTLYPSDYKTGEYPDGVFWDYKNGGSLAPSDLFPSSYTIYATRLNTSKKRSELTFSVDGIWPIFDGFYPDEIQQLLMKIGGSGITSRRN